jgi:hypothetical protein
MVVLVAIEAVAIVLLGVLVAGLLRSHAEILRTLHELGSGLDPSATPAPAPIPPPSAATGSGAAADITGETAALEPIAVSVTGAGRLTLLAFLSSGCLTCRAFFDAFEDPALEVPGHARLVIVARSPGAESPTVLARMAPARMTTVMSSTAWQDYSVPGSPYFVLVDGGRRRVIGEGTASTWPQISRMLENALADAGLTRPRHGPPAAPAAPVQTESRADAELRAAGIGPGHPSLHMSGEPLSDDE